MPAEVALNVDLRTGIIKPLKTNQRVENGHSGEAVYYDIDWLSGDFNYVQFEINGFRFLVFKRGGEWFRYTRKPRTTKGQHNETIPLGHARPQAPGVAIADEQGAAVAPEGGEYVHGYCVTTVRNTDGYEDESGPSGITWATNQKESFTVRFEGPTPAGAIRWKIYRISTSAESTSTFQLVSEVPIGTEAYTDSKDGSDLGEALPGLFDEDGVTVLRSPPDVSFDGMCTVRFYGALVAWKGTTIYFSEPDNPDSFPAQYQLTAGDTIIAIEIWGSEVYVFTTSGIQRCLGSSPLNMAITPQYFGEAALNRRCVTVGDDGIYYTAKNGMYRVNSAGHDSMSRQRLGEDWFKERAFSGCHMAYGDGVAYLFHSSGCLTFTNERGIGFIEHSGVYEGAYFDRKTTKMHVTRKGKLELLFGGSDDLRFDYRLGKLVLGRPDGKQYDYAQVYGVGKVVAVVSLDGVAYAPEYLNMDGGLMDSQITFPYTDSREAAIHLSGTCRISEIKAVVYE